MSCNCQEVAERGKEKVENSLEMELLKNYAKSAKRWFVAFFGCLNLLACNHRQFCDDEIKIIDMRRHGKSNVQIAMALNIAERTVSKYIKSIANKIRKEII